MIDGDLSVLGTIYTTNIVTMYVEDNIIITDYNNELNEEKD